MIDAPEKRLNSEQKEAVEYGEGPLLIIAGAGTGKTTVVTERIKYLISQKNVSPSEILALTFTEKAALEMEQRVDEILPLGYANMWIATFHSFCDRLLRNEAINIGLDPNFKLMTEVESIQLLRQNLFKIDLNYYRPLGNPNKFVEGMFKHFSRLKDEDISPEEYQEWASSQTGESEEEKEEVEKYQELARAYQFYEDLKIKKGVMDFSDLMSNTLRLFRTRSQILKNYRQKFKYILVDEFQDTNFAQYVLIKLLAPPPEANLTVVGDDNQAIYRWRGAAISNILQFKDDYPKAKEIVLNKNYRSTQTILDGAYRLIKNNDPDTLEAKLGICKKLEKQREVEEVKIEFLKGERAEAEAELVAKEILRLTNNGLQTSADQEALVSGQKTESYRYGDIAVLVRANNHAEPFMRVFDWAGIPYQFLGPGMLLRQPEIKDLMAYLQILYNYEDTLSTYRLLSMDYWQIGGRELAGLLNFSRKNHLSLLETCEILAGKRPDWDQILKNSENQILISPKTKETLQKLVEIIHRHLDWAKKETAGKILYNFLEETGLLARLGRYQDVHDEKRAQNIAKFFEKLKSYELEHEDASVVAVVDYLNLCLELGDSPLVDEADWRENDAVNILTIHSAKGLEFPVVFLVNLVNQRFPTIERREQIPLPEALIKEILPQGDYHLEEERRLFYVGMTRAKDRLYFTAANSYSDSKKERKISPFVLEVLGEQAINNKQEVISKDNNQLSIFNFKPEVKNNSPLTPRLSLISDLSYSQIETFTTCPQKYKFSYLLNLPVPPSAALVFGDLIHRVLYDFYRRVTAGQKPSKEDLLEILEKNWINLGYSSRAQREKYHEQGVKILSEFYEKGYQPGHRPLALEQSFKLRLGPVRLRGKIDRIDQTAAGIEIIDYKTGQSSTQKEVEKDYQLALYALAAVDGTLQYMGVLKETPLPEEVTVSFYFLENQEKVSTVKSQESLEEVKEKVIAKAEEIAKSDFSPTPGFACQFCEYKTLCDAWK